MKDCLPRISMHWQVTCTDFFSHSMHWEDTEGCVEAVTINIVPTFDGFPRTK